MADTRLSDLSAASALAASDLFYVVQSAGSGGAKATGTQLLTLVGTTYLATATAASTYLPLSGGTLTGLLTITQATANASVIASTGYSLTGSDATSMIDLAGTWNTSGTPTAIKLNVTDTASNASSLLMDLQVGGSSKLKVNKSGAVLAATGSSAGFTFDGVTTAAFYLQATNLGGGSNVVVLRSPSGVDVGIGSGQFRIKSSYAFGFSSGNPDAAALDVMLARDAAAVLALRNSTTAQAFRIYGTYTDASNYERLTLKTTAGTSVELAAETAGTGGDNLDVKLTPAGTGGVVLGANYQQFTEMTAPAAGASNTVRIYAEDNGSGKTRLMAIFPTGVAQQIAIEP